MRFLKRIALLALSVLAFAMPARANPCLTPQGYLVICCPKPCVVWDPLTDAQEAEKQIVEALKLNEMIAQLTSWQNQVKAVGNVVGGFASLVGQVNALTAGLQSIAAPTFPSIDLSKLKDITSTKGAMSSLFFSPTPTSGMSVLQMMSARIATAQTAIADLEAVAQHTRAVMTNAPTNLTALSTAAGASKDLQGDLAVANLIRLSILQVLQTGTTVDSSLVTGMGTTTALNLGTDGVNAASSYTASGSTPFSQAPQPVTTNTSPSSNVVTATQVTTALLSVDTAVDLHNALASAGQLALGMTDAASVAQTASDAQQLAQNAQAGLVTALSTVYADPNAAAQAMLADFARGVTPDYSDTGDRTAQETANDQSILANVMAGSANYGAMTCPPGQTGVDANGNPANCNDLIGSAITASLYTAGDTASQAAWFAPAGAEASAAASTNTDALTNLNTATGVDLSAATAQIALSADIASATKAVSDAQNLAGLTPTQMSQLQAAQATMQAVSADSALSYYLSYDQSVPPAPTASTIAASTGN